MTLKAQTPVEDSGFEWYPYTDSFWTSPDADFEVMESSGDQGKIEYAPRPGRKSKSAPKSDADRRRCREFSPSMLPDRWRLPDYLDYRAPASDATYASGYSVTRTQTFQESPKLQGATNGMIGQQRAPVSYQRPFGAWERKSLPLRVYICSNIEDARDGKLKQIFIESVNAWCRASENRVKCIITDDFKTADIYLTREFTTDHELAENCPTFYNGALERVKVRFIDSTCDRICEPQLKAVCLHSLGHAFGVLLHSNEKNDVMCEEAAHVWHPVTQLSENDAKRIRMAYRFLDPPIWHPVCVAPKLHPKPGSTLRLNRLQSR